MMLIVRTQDYGQSQVRVHQAKVEQPGQKTKLQSKSGMSGHQASSKGDLDVLSHQCILQSSNSHEGEQLRGLSQLPEVKIDLWFSTRAVLLSRGYLAMSGDTLSCHN